MAGHIGLELRCAERIFISLNSRQSSDLPVPAQIVPSSQRNNFLFQVYPAAQLLAHDLLGAASAHRSSNPVTRAYRIRTAVGFSLEEDDRPVHDDVWVAPGIAAPAPTRSRSGTS